MGVSDKSAAISVGWASTSTLEGKSRLPSFSSQVRRHLVTSKNRVSYGKTNPVDVGMESKMTCISMQSSCVARRVLSTGMQESKLTLHGAIQVQTSPGSATSTQEVPDMARLLCPLGYSSLSGRHRLQDLLDSFNLPWSCCRRFQDGLRQVCSVYRTRIGTPSPSKGFNDSFEFINPCIAPCCTGAKIGRLPHLRNPFLYSHGIHIWHSLTCRLRSRFLLL